MPSGAKKRKAAKKKLQKKANNITNINGSHSNSQGSEDPKSYDQRENDDVVVERIESVEGRNVEAIVRIDDVGKNGKDKSSSSSGSSSGSSSNSDDDEVVIEKGKSKEPELGKVEASVDTAGVSEVGNGSVEERIPKEESIKQVVSLPRDNSSASDVIKSSSQQNVDQFSRPFEEKFVVVSDVEEIGDEVATIMDGCCKNTSENECITARDDDGLLPQSSDVEECYAGDDGKASETQKHPEQQPLLPSAPTPVRRTSWMDCCGLSEVFFGGSRR